MFFYSYYLTTSRPFQHILLNKTNVSHGFVTFKQKKSSLFTFKAKNCNAYIQSKTVSPKDLCRDCYSYSPVIKHTFYILTKKIISRGLHYKKQKTRVYFFLRAKNCNIFYRILPTFKNCEPKRFVSRLLLLFSRHKTHFLYFNQKYNLSRTTLQRAENACF